MNQQRLMSQQKLIIRQYKLNNSIITNNSTDEKTRNELIKINKDYDKLFMTECYVCNKKKNSLDDDMSDTEYISMETSWGYFSTHDYERHELVLCCDCYDKHLLNSELGKYIKIEEYR